MARTRTDRFKTAVLLLSATGRKSRGFPPARAIDVAVILTPLRRLRPAAQKSATPEPHAFSSGKADSPEGATP